MNNRTEYLLHKLAKQEKSGKQEQEKPADETADSYSAESELLEMMRDIRAMPGRDF